MGNKLLTGSVRIKKGGGGRYFKSNAPWIYSNELEKFDKTIPPGSWVSLENDRGSVIGYGFFNPHSLIAYRAFDRIAFESEDQTRALFFKKLDWALKLRQDLYRKQIQSSMMGLRSFRLCFGESDGMPGLIVDLFEANPSGVAVIQCHSAGADQLITWTQQWLEERLGIDRGVIKNDLEIRKREQVACEVLEWGSLPNEAWALEGGVRFLVPLKGGQKTGYFYDHRDNRAKLSEIAASIDGPVSVIDFFSYTGSWGLQILKANSKARLLAVDVSSVALELVKENGKLNGLSDRVEIFECDVLKDAKKVIDHSRKLGGFDIVISDPPSMSASAKHKNQSFRAHQDCFQTAFQTMKSGGIAAFASCSFHLTWDDFLETLPKEGLRLFYHGAQAMDHPVLTSLPESRYIKCAFAR